MQLQRGKFLVKNIDELENKSNNKIIDLSYMGAYEYEGNAIPISRMFIEFYQDEYLFYETNIYNKNHQQMYLYVKKEYIDEFIKNNSNYITNIINRNFSLWEYINKDEDKCIYDFWWNINCDYFVFFGEFNKELITYFINDCYNRDGGKKEIKRKLLKVGYKL